MEIRIGVTQTPKEIEIDMGDDIAGDDLVEEITSSVGQEGAMLWLTDKKGRRVGIPTGKLAYVEIGAPRSGQRVGFSAPVTTIGS